MTKYTFISEQDEWEDIDDNIHPAKTTTMELEIKDQPWDTLVEEFLNFLNGSGYVIDPVAIPEMMQLMSDFHFEKVIGVSKYELMKENVE